MKSFKGGRWDERTPILDKASRSRGYYSGMPLTVFFSADGLDRSELLPLSPLAPTMEEEPLVIFMSGEDDPEKSEERKKAEELRSLWRKAIHQQILLLRMEKENQKLEG